MWIKTAIGLCLALFALLAIDVTQANARFIQFCPKSGYGWDGKIHCNYPRWLRRHPGPARNN
jgi:hypothetical protein